MADEDAGENPPGGAPSFDGARRSGGRAQGRLPVPVALEELEELERSAEVPRRRWTDEQPADRPTAPDALTAVIVADTAATAPAAEPHVPEGGPQFLGRVSAPVGPPERRRFRSQGTSDVPPPGTRLSAWSRSGPVVPPASPRGGRATRGFLWVLVIACAGVGVVAGYPRVRDLIRERSVPAALRSYVTGKGVQYAPAGQGFAARLPEPPVRRDGALPPANGQPAMFVHRSIASGASYEIVIRVVDVPHGLPLPFGAVGALADPRISGGAPVNVRRTSFAGTVAFDYDQRSGSSPLIRSVVFLHEQRLYLISVQSKAGDVVLQTLGRSFRFTR